MQKLRGNYWKRPGIVWRELTLLQAVFLPYLAPPASYLSGSLTYRLTKPCRGSQIISVIDFILVKRTCGGDKNKGAGRFFLLYWIVRGLRGRNPCQKAVERGRNV